MARSSTEALIVDGLRTPRGRGKPSGGLHDIHPQELMAQVLNSLIERVGIDSSDVDDVIVGNGTNDGDHGQNIGRLSVLAAGWAPETPGTTVNRFCGSGQQAIMFASTGIASGFQRAVVAGGVESTSRWLPPSGVLGAGNEALRARHPMVHQGVAADLIASLEGFTRDDVDEFAAISQQRTSVAIEEGRFARSIVPVMGADGTVALAHDEHPRPGTTAAQLSKLEPSFVDIGGSVDPLSGLTQDQICLDRYPEAGAIEHVHHAGNSSGRVDGAAAVLVASSDFVEEHGLRPRARVVSLAVRGSEPVIMLTAPAPASLRCLELAGMRVDDIDLWEVNEAFAAVPLQVIKALDLDPDRVNVNGGAIALGHPIGATGAILVQTVLDELERRDLSTGLITMCTGGGMATATIIERL
jgi:acetyl-CoA C-acetyltransferase